MNIEKLQTALPLGYLYLVTLGIIKETIVFYQLGINIMKYTTIMDILLSPIAVIASNVFYVVFFIIISFYPFFQVKMFKKHSDKKWVRSIFGFRKNKAELNEEETKKYSNEVLISAFLTTYFSIFIGMALYEGLDKSNKIKNDKLVYNMQINYNSGETEIASILDSNSEYYFYVAKGDKHIKITPIGSIKNLEVIENKKLEK